MSLRRSHAWPRKITNPWPLAAPLASLLVCVTGFGCRSVPPPKIDPEILAAARSDAVTIRTNQLVIHAPREPHRFTTCQKMNPIWWFKNADEPIAPAWYRPGQRGRNFRYHLRNPGHNLGYYVLGIADKPFTRVGRFPGNMASPVGRWNWAVCRYKRLRLPFVDYHRGRFECYAGWRTGGNFCLKFNFAKPKPKPPP